MKKESTIFAWIRELFSEEDDPNEPQFDPVHLGGTVVISLTAIGCLYWLLWTLLVYEGGIFLKLYAIGRLFIGSASLKDIGWEGYPYALGDLEGVVGNFIALILMSLILFGLRRLYLHGAETSRRRS